jgi:hypothetical protein
MKIIILEGDNDKGKTTTIGMVFLALHIKGRRETYFNPLQSPSGMDFEAVFDNQDDEEQKKIAIYSKGDNINDCNAAIQKYSQKNMDVLIIAYSTRKTGLTIPQNDQPFPVKKTVASPSISEVKANRKDCNKIISLI